MGTAIAMRRDYSSRELRRLATRVKEAAQARRLLAIAAVLDGSSREEAAKIGGMDRQTLRDWVIRFNEEGPDSLVNKSSPGAPGKLIEEHKAFLVRLVEEGPIPSQPHFAQALRVQRGGVSSGPSRYRLRRRQEPAHRVSLGGR